MTKMRIALSAVALGLAAATPAHADFSIIRWDNGDCRIWSNFQPSPPPWGTGWTIVAPNIPTYAAARATLNDLAKKKTCAFPTWI